MLDCVVVFLFGPSVFPTLVSQLVPVFVAVLDFVLFFSPHLCVGFLFFILYPASSSSAASALPLCHTHLCHTPSFTHNFVTHRLSHTSLSPTIFHPPSFTHIFVTHHLSHIFVTHHLSHTSLSPTIFHTHLCHPLSFTHVFVTHHLFTHIFVTHHLSLTSLSPIFHTHLCHTSSFTHIFVTHHLSHTSLSHTIFHTQLCTFVTHHLSTCIHLRFAWQTWHIWHWAGSGGALGAVLVAGDAAALCVWQAWHLWHLAGSGGAPGAVLVAGAPRHFAWQALNLVTSKPSTCVLRGTSGTGLALVARLGRFSSPVTPWHFAWQAWHLATNTVLSRGRRGTW